MGGTTTHVPFEGDQERTMQDTSTWRPIRYRDPMGAVDWLVAAFGFELRSTARRQDGSFAYAHLALGTCQIAVTARDERSLVPAGVETAGTTAVVADLATHFARAEAAGAGIVRAIEAGAPGYVCRDVEGNLWSFDSAQDHRAAKAIAWARSHGLRLERVAAHRAGIAAAAAVTIVAVAVPAWHFHAARPGPSLKVAEAQVLENARFALAEEQSARLAAEASRRAALDDLVQERAARRDAERDALKLEGELADARATQATAEALARNLDAEMGWSTQVAPTSTQGAPLATADIVPVAVAARAEPAPAPLSANPALAAGQAALTRGDISEARHLFRRLADSGMAEAALALGSTYDPVNTGLAGLSAGDVDRVEAKRWYRRAIELAQAAAEQEHAP
jgi:uncharacterized glyoxalase superfamily protein PhnB